MSFSEQEYIEKIKSSNCFQNKDTSARLLDYLFEAAKASRILKETDIAEEFFDRKNQFIPGEDTIVRVNIFKLRQLLRDYYQNDGKKDKLQFSIPKRKYSLLIEENHLKDNLQSRSLSRGEKNNFKNREIIFVTALMISVFLNLLSIFRNAETVIPPHPVWSDFSDSTLSNSLILGNPLFYEAVNSENGTSLIVRDLRFNDPYQESAKEELSKKINGYEVQDLPYPYFSHNSVWALSDIIGAVGTKNPLIIKTKTETTVDDFNRGNVIFVSNINSYGFVRHFLSKTSFEVGINNNRILLNTGEKFSALGNAKGAFTEYGFFAKIPGENGNVIALIGDSNSTGIKGAVNLLSDQEMFDNLMDQYGYTEQTFPKYFELIVKTNSFNYSALKTEVVHFQAIE